MTGNTATSFPASTCSSKSRTRRGRPLMLSASTASAISRPFASRRRSTGATAAPPMRVAVLPRALCLHHDHRMAIDRLDCGKCRAILDRDAGPGERRHGVRERASDGRIGFRRNVLKHRGAEHGPRRRQLGHDPCQRHHVRRAAGQEADGVERGSKRHRAPRRHRTMGRLPGRDAAGMGGNAHRAAGVGTQRSDTRRRSRPRPPSPTTSRRRCNPGSTDF